ncbi:MAG: hypothetical protein AAF604_20275 [Acidobacteriota bacterium]
MKVKDLRIVSNILFDYLESTGRGDVRVEEDFYWSVPQEHVYNPACDPEELFVGQLSDDCKELSAILSGENPPIGYALVWLSAVLRVVGEKTVS